MASRAKVKVVGFRWLSSRPGSACEQCASLHNQEFYYQPKAGQRPVGDMPDPPLHPNCRCHTKPITVTTVELESQEGKPSYIEGGSKVLGGYWGNNGRSVIDGLIYQKWCGKYWSAGRDTRDPNALGAADPTPADDMDAACAGHDDCYDMFDEDYCDKQLIKNIQDLADDPRMWRNPPDNVKDARKVRWAITTLFRLKIRMEENRNQGYKESLPISP